MTEPTTSECPWCGETVHAADDCVSRDPFAIETWNEVLS